MFIGGAAKGPAGHLGSRLRADLAKTNQRLPLLGHDGVTADRNYIKEFVTARSRELGRQYGVEYAEVFYYIPPGASGADRDPRVEKYIKEHVVPIKYELPEELRTHLFPPGIGRFQPNSTFDPIVGLLSKIRLTRFL